MDTTEAITDLPQAATQITTLLGRVRKEGRRVLVVIGAGCSYAANVPLMKDVYKYLRARLEPDAANHIPDEHGHLARLREWLSILAEEGGPRSLAARSLGQFQQPQLIEEARVRNHLVQVWDAFALDFLTWKVTAPERPTNGPTILTAKPTQFHRRIASWVKEDLASVVSLNFDGLMRNAIEEECGGRCIILAKREEIDGHWFGEKAANKKADESPIRALIKVWGDVFHAKCRNSLCRAFGHPVALYDLRRNQSSAEKIAEFDAAKLLACPDCGDGRQLQVFFTGYQQKEDDAERVLDGIRQRTMPSIGGIVTVGVSGLWDAPLRRLLSEIGHYLQADRESHDEAGIQLRIPANGVLVLQRH